MTNRDKAQEWAEKIDNTSAGRVLSAVEALPSPWNHIADFLIFWAVMSVVLFLASWAPILLVAFTEWDISRAGRTWLGVRFWIAIGFFVAAWMRIKELEEGKP